MSCKGQIELIGKKRKRKALNKVCYREDKIIEKSLEIFNDEDPCIIHRTHSAMRLCLELIDIVDKNNLQNNVIKVSDNHIVWEYLYREKFIEEGVKEIIII